MAALAKVIVMTTSDGALHVSIAGRLDEHFVDQAKAITDFGSVPRAQLDLSGVESLTSLGVRELENVFDALVAITKNVNLIDVSAAVARQLIMIPTLAKTARVISAKLPFVCPVCATEKIAAVPWAKDADVKNAPKCTCGATMELDGLAPEYLP